MLHLLRIGSCGLMSAARESSRFATSLVGWPRLGANVSHRYLILLYPSPECGLRFIVKNKFSG